MIRSKWEVRIKGYFKNWVESYLSEGGLSGMVFYIRLYKRSLPYLLDTHTHAHEGKILPLSIIMSPKRKGACNHLDNTISAEVGSSGRVVEFQTLKYTFCIQN